ncbi:peptide deformylase [Gryllotalpicola ginsengisoli]|uniref:peptide deformylase n=1 Tax=Gryllotalpicola ginsengisoli TaxID=444608 RepID=UPI0003B6C4A0|nr:peptide deformylase [Gryllotalpicola ginsengisoli]
MTVRPIRLFGDPVLKTVCDPVVDFDEGVRALVKDLLDSVQLPGRAGVAANQIGSTLRVFSYNVDGKIGYLINPRVVEVRGEKQPTGEGCLSVPGLWFDTPRHPWARAVGFDVDGNELEVQGEGTLAQALQHETDHLDGLLYLDRLEKPARREAMKQIRESDWF